MVDDNDTRGTPMPRLIVGIRLILVGIVLASLSAAAAHNVRTTLRNLPAWDDTSYPESAMVERALAVASGEELYSDPARWPYNTALYGPMLYYAVGLPMRAIPPPSEATPSARLGAAHQAAVLGRLISFVAGLSMLVWLLLMPGRLGLGGGWRFLPALLFLASEPVLVFWWSYRPDPPMVALILWSWAAALALSGPVGPVLAAVLMALALSFKQSAALAAGALLIWLVIDGRRKAALVYAATLAGALVAGGALLTFESGGLVWANTVGALRAPFRPQGALEFLITLNVLHLIPLAGGLAACTLWIGKRDEARALRWAFLLAFLSAELLATRVGAYTTYYMETFAWGAVLTAALLRDLTAETRGRAAGQAAAHGLWVALLLVLAIPALGQAREDLRRLRSKLEPHSVWHEKNRDLVQALEGFDGPILTSDPYVLWVTESPPTIMDLFLYSARVKAGGLRTDDLRSRLEGEEFDLIVLEWEPGQRPPGWKGVPVFTDDVLASMRGHYAQLDKLEEYVLLAPRGREPPPLGAR